MSSHFLAYGASWCSGNAIEVQVRTSAGLPVILSVFVVLYRVSWVMMT